MITYRFLTPEDVSTVVEFAYLHAPEIPSWGEVDKDHLYKHLMGMVLDPMRFMLGVFLNGEFKGGLIGEITPTWFNLNYESQDRTIYLHKDVRGKGVALALFEQYDKWVMSHTFVKQGGLQTTSGVDLSPLVSKLGYVKVGTTFIKRY